MQAKKTRSTMASYMVMAGLLFASAQASGTELLQTLPAAAAPLMQKKAPTKKASNKKKVAGKGKPQSSGDPTAETADMRERRLLRECKGRPNAGACTGYAT